MSVIQRLLKVKNGDVRFSNLKKNGGFIYLLIKKIKIFEFNVLAYFNYLLLAVSAETG